MINMSKLQCFYIKVISEATFEHKKSNKNRQSYERQSILQSKVEITSKYDERDVLKDKPMHTFVANCLNWTHSNNRISVFFVIWHINGFDLSFVFHFDILEYANI